MPIFQYQDYQLDGRLHSSADVSHKARRLTKEHREHIGLALKGRPKSEQTRRRMALAHTGAKRSDSMKAAMRTGQQRRRLRDRVEVACQRCATMFCRRWQGHGIQRFCSRRCASARPKQSPEIERLSKFMRNCLHRIGVNTKALAPLQRHSEQILGYSKADLRGHLEARFRDGMGWHNYGYQARGQNRRWVIDHIYPIVAFIKAGLHDPRVINALDNLQPLWTRDNVVKRAKVTLDASI